jgi:hypothetical protein
MSDQPLETSELKYGRVVVGLEAVQLTNPTTLYANVVIFADNSNTSKIYVGNREALQAVGPLGGIPIYPSGSISLPVRDPSQLWVIAEDVDQLVYWFGG